MKRRRSVLVAAVCAAATLGVVAPAYAFWTVGSSAATGTAKAGALGTPTVSVSAVTATNVTVTVTAAPATGITPTAYRVARTAPGTAVASVCTVAGSTGSCSDPSPVAGSSNTYAVYARYTTGGAGWESSSPATVNATVPSADSTPPNTPTITFPTAGGTYTAAGWTGTITGTASDDTGGSGIAATQVSIKLTSGSSNGQYWNGTAFSGTTVTWLGASSSGTGNTGWSYAFARPADGTYTVQARSVDNAGNTGATAASAGFTIDTTAASVAFAAGGGVTNPVNSVNVSTAAANGTVKAGSTVTVTGSDGATPAHTVTANATVTGTTWSVTGLNLTTLVDGTITYTAKATDAAGTTATATATATKDVVAPTLASVSSAGGTANKMEQNDTLTLTFSEAMDTSGVGSTVAVTEKRSGNSSNVTLSVPGLIADVAINTGYVSSANGASATATGTVTWSADHKTAAVTLGAVSGAPATGTGGATITPASGLKDASGNPVGATVTKPVINVF